MELDLENPMSTKNSYFYMEMHPGQPHVIQDYPWAKKFWISLHGQREISFFHKSLVECYIKI